jgi:hypothetical protein
VLLDDQEIEVGLAAIRLQSDASRRGLLPRVALPIVLLASMLGPETIAQTPIRSDLWVPDGTVSTIARHGNILYFGGSFGRVGPRTGSAVVVDTATAQVIAPAPQIDGQVGALVSDGAGGWFVGGSFHSVCGQARRNLAHLLANGTLAPWAPEPDSAVSSLAVSGGSIYVGGNFASIAGVARQRLAALDATTGAATPWNPGANAYVRTIALQGSVLYAGGLFTHVGSADRKCIAALDLSGGLATDWNPATGPVVSYVSTIVPSGSVIYLGGSFENMGGEFRRNAAAVDASTGLATAWNPDATGGFSPNVTAIAIGNDVAYLGGAFTTVGNVSRTNIAAVDLAAGALTSWNPYSDGWVATMTLVGNRLFVGGNFTGIGSDFRRGAAALDTSSGFATSWNPGASPWVATMAVSGTRVAIGGGFWSVGGVSRNHVAAMNLVTGQVTSWNPSPYGNVNALLFARDRIYVGGQFVFLGAVQRTSLAAVDTVLGDVLPWEPQNFFGPVNTLALHGSDLIVGGDFQFSGVNRFAMIDTSTALLKHPGPYQGDVDQPVYALHVHGNTLYVGGAFTQLLGNSAWRVAAIDLTQVTDEYPDLFSTGWTPYPNQAVHAIVAADGIVYLGGDFTAAGYHFRGRLAAIDSVSALATSWRPEPDGSVYSLAIDGHTLYAGGYFGTIAGAVRTNVAALDLNTHTATSWDPAPDGTVLALLAGNGQVAVGGAFDYIGSLSQGCLAFLTSPEFTAVEPPVFLPTLELAQSTPNPCRARTRIRFTIPRSGLASMELLDAQGRRVVSLLDRAAVAAGSNLVEFDASALRPGIYWYRLEMDGQVESRRLVVMR